MEAKQLTGPNAGSLKYDIFTALSVAGLHGSPGLHVSMLRLCALITARYNWRREELSVGQRDMARMWNVNERTVKREIKRWTEAQLLICKRPGVRGRVGAYRLNLAQVCRMSEPYWSAVGPDFVERMTAFNPVQASKVVKVDFGGANPEIPPQEPVSAKKGTWRAAAQRFRQLHPENYVNWIAPLEFVSDDGRLLVLRAQTKFASRYIATHLMGALSEAIETEIGPMRRVEIVVDGARSL